MQFLRITVAGIGFLFLAASVLLGFQACGLQVRAAHLLGTGASADDAGGLALGAFVAAFVCWGLFTFLTEFNTRDQPRR